MSDGSFRVAVIAVGLAFSALFSGLVVPPLIDDPEFPGAFGAGFVKPYAAGYSADVIACWVILAIWIVFEASSRSVKHGWLRLVAARYWGGSSMVSKVGPSDARIAGNSAIVGGMLV